MILNWLFAFARPRGTHVRESLGVAETRPTMPTRAPELDGTQLAEPDRSDLDAILAVLKEQRRLSAIDRAEGDHFNKMGLNAQAMKAFSDASLQNMTAIRVGRSYMGFRQLFDDSGIPVKGRNYPLEGLEAEFARIYCDTLGRQGGLLRRLGKLEDALKFYQLGAQIEERSQDLAFENSYSTMNAISIQIELGIKTASRFKSNRPDLAEEIGKARSMITKQIERGKRGEDAWAKADLAIAIMLSNDKKATAEEVPVCYELYANKAAVEDIQKTLRILSLLCIKLKDMRDPVADLIENGASVLRSAAAKAGKSID